MSRYFFYHLINITFTTMAVLVIQAWFENLVYSSLFTGLSMGIGFGVSFNLGHEDALESKSKKS